jgi:hypothetical protein
MIGLSVPLLPLATACEIFWNPTRDPQSDRDVLLPA